MGCEAIFIKSIPKFLPILSPYLIYRGLYPASKYFRAALRMDPMSIDDVVVPSPANLLVELTDFLIKVQTASFNLSSCMPLPLHIRCV